MSLLLACGKPAGIGGAAGDASPSTIAANTQATQGLALDQRQGFDDAQRGFIAKPTGKIVAADGTVLNDLDAYGFLAGPAPAATLLRPRPSARAARQGARGRVPRGD